MPWVRDWVGVELMVADDDFGYWFGVFWLFVFVVAFFAVLYLGVF